MIPRVLNDEITFESGRRDHSFITKTSGGNLHTPKVVHFSNEEDQSTD